MPTKAGKIARLCPFINKSLNMSMNAVILIEMLSLCIINISRSLFNQQSSNLAPTLILIVTMTMLSTAIVFQLQYKMIIITPIESPQSQTA